MQREATAWAAAGLEPEDRGPGDALPVLDFAPYLRGEPGAMASLAAALQQACESTGFFFAKNHSVPAAVTARAFAASAAFHALPLTRKRAMAETDGMGYLEVGHRKLPRREHGNRNAAVIFKKGAVVAPVTVDCPDGVRTVSLADNPWPAGEDEFRAAVEAYAGAVEGFAKKLARVYAVALGLAGSYFDEAVASPLWRLRLSHYPPTDTGTPGFGIAPHVDTSFFTLLAQDTHAGLCICRADGSWRKVPPASCQSRVPQAQPGVERAKTEEAGPASSSSTARGADAHAQQQQQQQQQPLLVNTGELLKMWSNDLFRSTKHYVKPMPPAAQGGESRYSIPFFFNADARYVMACLPTCTSADNPPKYKPMSYLESQGVAQGE